MVSERESFSPEKKRLGRLDAAFRFSSSGGLPDLIKWRGKSFILHHNNPDETAVYTAPSGPHAGQLVVDKQGFVLSGHDDKFKEWSVSEKELGEESPGK